MLKIIIKIKKYKINITEIQTKIPKRYESKVNTIRHQAHLNRF